MLTPEQIEHFITYGFVKLDGCLDRAFCAEQVQRGWERSGYDPADASTWEKDRLHLSTKTSWKIADIAPQAHAAIGQLCGGHERIQEPYWGDGFIINFRIGADRPWQDPSPAAHGWHKDGDFFHHFLDSPEQALLTIVIWQDVAERGGATFIAADSIAPVAEFLAQHPEGESPNGFPTGHFITQCRDFRQAVGRAGDVYLMHPFMLHASSPNLSGIARFITNPPIHYREPMNFFPPRSPVEQAICRALRVEQLDFRISGERRRVVPGRYQTEIEQDAAEAQRKAGLLNG